MLIMVLSFHLMAKKEMFNLHFNTHLEHFTITTIIIIIKFIIIFTQLSFLKQYANSYCLSE